MTAVNNNISKDKLLRAIDEYPLLTKNVKIILKILAMFEEPITAESIIQSSGFAKQIIYPALNKLLKLKLINKIKSHGSSYFVFSLNETNIFKVLELYEKTQFIKQQIKT